MRKVLVSGASGVVGYGILKSLRKSFRDLYLIGTTIYEDSVAQKFCDIFEKAPRTSDDVYIDWLLDTILKHEINLIIPGIEDDLYKWTEYKSIIEKSGVKILLNNTYLTYLCRDKWLFYEKLNEINSPYRINSSLSQDFEYLKKEFDLPFLLKPRCGFASKGIVKIYTICDFQKYQDKIGKTLMAQPIIGNDDEEFTTAIFGDGKGGFYCYIALQRKLSKEGYTEKAEVVNLDGLEEVLLSLCQHLKPVGPTNFQFRRQDGCLKLLEINPRISSSTSIRTIFGYNECEMSVDYYLDNKIPEQPYIKQGRVVRYIEEMVFI